MDTTLDLLDKITPADAFARIRALIAEQADAIPPADDAEPALNTVYETLRLVLLLCGQQVDLAERVITSDPPPSTDTVFSVAYTLGSLTSALKPARDWSVTP